MSMQEWTREEWAERMCDVHRSQLASVLSILSEQPHKVEPHRDGVSLVPDEWLRRLEEWKDRVESEERTRIASQPAGREKDPFAQWERATYGDYPPGGRR